ncbi:MAG: SDR family NAD(P)-dependent oxidoreductase [Candidatus Daviesbacteria bacterium]|nr:SDR family NAD(P)-dependent oxidoreductase [Candidatus Daviesbacteria bacterium]
MRGLLDLSGKAAIVTGGSVGIGAGIVKRFQEAGANVVIADLATGCNVSKEEDVKKLVAETVEKYGSIDILVNNAGIYPNVPLSLMTLEDFEKVIKVNLEGVFLTTKYVSEQMIKQGRGGKIINISSIDALHPSMIGLSAYDASKHGVWGFTKNTALELAQHKIWVNAIAPGGIVTPGVVKAQEGAGKIDPKIMEAFMNKIPMHRMGEPDEIGKVALFLASEMSSYMTGSQIVVDGGALLS